MPIIILLLLAILIVLIGGPLALGFAVAIPAWLIWASGALQIAFWSIVALAGLSAVIAVAVTATAFLPRSRVMPVPKNTVPTETIGRFKCTTCGTERDQAFARCFKCEPFKLKELEKPAG